MSRFLKLFILAWLIPAPAWASELPEATDLAGDAASGRPVLVLFEAPDCPYCIQVSQDFLEPMSRNAGYRSRVVLRRLSTRSGDLVTGFDGKPTSGEKLARQYRVQLTPTVVLLGPDGRLLTEPLVGLTTPDFYGAYLDEAIARAEAALGQQTGEAQTRR